MIFSLWGLNPASLMATDVANLYTAEVLTAGNQRTNLKRLLVSVEISFGKDNETLPELGTRLAC